MNKFQATPSPMNHSFILRQLASLPQDKPIKDYHIRMLDRLSGCNRLIGLRLIGKLSECSKEVEIGVRAWRRLATLKQLNL